MCVCVRARARGKSEHSNELFNRRGARGFPEPAARNFADGKCGGLRPPLRESAEQRTSYIARLDVLMRFRYRPGHFAKRLPPPPPPSYVYRARYGNRNRVREREGERGRGDFLYGGGMRRGSARRAGERERERAKGGAPRGVEEKTTKRDREKECRRNGKTDEEENVRENGK